MTCDKLKGCCIDRNTKCQREQVCIVYRGTRTLAKCEEKRKSYILDNNENHYEIALYRVDDGIIPRIEDHKKADFMFLVYKNRCTQAILVELKGTDIVSSIQQVDMTLTKLFPFLSMHCNNVHGRIICSSGVPDIRNDIRFINLDKRFRRLHGKLDKQHNTFTERVDDL